MPVQWYQQQDERITLQLHVQPGAKHTSVAGLHGTALKIRLAAPPVDGKANQCLLVWLADFFAVPQRHVELVSGQTSRQKRVAIHGSRVDPERLLDGGR